MNDPLVRFDLPGKPLLLLLLCFALLVGANRAQALEVIFDGESSGEFTDSYTFNFGSSDITHNTKDTYDFWVSGDATAQASVQLVLDPCTHGCGNPAISYNIYADGQKLAANGDGTYTLTMGDHTYQIRITGMGSGNNVGYDGSITFRAVSPTPEAGEWLIMLIGLGAAAFYARRRIPGARKDQAAPRGWGSVPVPVLAATRA